MDTPHVYDKSKFHQESINKLGLPEEHAENHTIFFLRWLIENDLMSAFFVDEGAEILRAYGDGEATIHDVYGFWDNALIDDMLSDRGNAFALHYFEFGIGAYLDDYIAILQRDLPSEFHVVYSDENYRKIRSAIDRRYREWSARKP